MRWIPVLHFGHGVPGMMAPKVRPHPPISFEHSYAYIIWASWPPATWSNSSSLNIFFSSLMVHLSKNTTFCHIIRGLAKKVQTVERPSKFGGSYLSADGWILNRTDNEMPKHISQWRHQSRSEPSPLTYHRLKGSITQGLSRFLWYPLLLPLSVLWLTAL